MLVLGSFKKPVVLIATLNMVYWLYWLSILFYPLWLLFWLVHLCLYSLLDLIKEVRAFKLTEFKISWPLCLLYFQLSIDEEELKFVNLINKYNVANSSGLYFSSDIDPLDIYDDLVEVGVPLDDARFLSNYAFLSLNSSKGKSTPSILAFFLLVFIPQARCFAFIYRIFYSIKIKTKTSPSDKFKFVFGNLVLFMFFKFIYLLTNYPARIILISSAVIVACGGVPGYRGMGKEDYLVKNTYQKFKHHLNSLLVGINNEFITALVYEPGYHNLRIFKEGLSKWNFNPHKGKITITINKSNLSKLPLLAISPNLSSNDDLELGVIKHGNGAQHYTYKTPKGQLYVLHTLKNLSKVDKLNKYQMITAGDKSRNPYIEGSFTHVFSDKGTGTGVLSGIMKANSEYFSGRVDYMLVDGNTAPHIIISDKSLKTKILVFDELSNDNSKLIADFKELSGEDLGNLLIHQRISTLPCFQCWPSAGISFGSKSQIDREQLKDIIVGEPNCGLIIVDENGDLVNSVIGSNYTKQEYYLNYSNKKVRITKGIEGLGDGSGGFK